MQCIYVGRYYRCVVLLHNPSYIYTQRNIYNQASFTELLGVHTVVGASLVPVPR